MPKLQTNPNNYTFNLPAAYTDDVWEVCKWDKYLNADADHQNAWKARSKVMDYKMDFSLCDIPLMREESKYFSYYLLEERKITLRTFAEYADRFKLLFKFVNDRDYQSVLDIDLDDFSIFVSGRHKLTIDNGTTLIGDKIVPAKKKNRIISFVTFMQSTIAQYLEADRPLYERDVWLWKDLCAELHIDDSATDIHNLVFDIMQPEMRAAAKTYIKDMLPGKAIGTAHAILRHIKIFCRWLDEFDDSIQSFKDVTRDTLEEYFSFLRVEADFSQNLVNTNIQKLSQMFAYGIVFNNPAFPGEQLILKDDWVFKTTRRVEFYTDDEIAAIFSLIPYLPKIYGRLLLILHHTGMRIGELLRLHIDALKYTPKREPYLSIYMYKTGRYTNSPIVGYAHELIVNEIKFTKKRFPDAKYVFVDTNGNPISYHTFIETIKRQIVEHDIHGRDGKLLVFKTHKFRATKATNLIDMGYDPHVVANMLGHKNLGSLTYYVAAKEQSLQEEMQEYLHRQSILINSIGKMDETVLEDYKNARPLCNGFCCRPVEMGLCENLNACLKCHLFKPTLKHLTGYKLQRAEVESSLAVAKANNQVRVIEQCKQEMEALDNIIKRLESGGI